MDSEKGKIVEGKTKESRKMVKTYMAFLWSFLGSLGGGLLLAWWEYEYHPENRQLWMVPFGLIMFTTPLVIWLAIFASDICGCTEDVIQPDDGSIHEPGKVIHLVTSTA